MDFETRLKEVFAETFNIGKEKIHLSTQQSNLDEWDSLGQLRLIMSVEETFNVSFQINEINELNSFEKILESIREKAS